MNQAQPQGGQQGQQDPNQGRPSMAKMMMIYFVMNWIMGFFFKKEPQNHPQLYKNLYADGEPLEFKMYVSEDYEFNPEGQTPVWEETGIYYNYEKTNFRQKVINYSIDDILDKNETHPQLYAHFYLNSLRPKDSENYSDFAPYLDKKETVELIVWRKKSEKKEEVNLLFDDSPAANKQKKEEKNLTKSEKDEEKYPHLRTRIWFQLVHDTNPYNGPTANFMEYKIHETEWGYRFYEPILDTAQFWLRKKDYVLLERGAENKTGNITFEFNTYWIQKYMVERQLRNPTAALGPLGSMMSADTLKEVGLIQEESAFEEIKEIVLEANPILFGLTIAVHLLHSVFEFLALKNDISFWKNVESHRGLSLRTLWYSLFQDVVVLLYLLDNETSMVIIVSAIAELGVTIWKILKTMKFKRREDGKFPWIQYDYKDERYKSTTLEHDQVANKYLNYALVPLLGGYAIYSLIYEKHKGWYSFIIETLVGFIYLFGFIEMTPQLYINYKLKSVEHLPWRVMVYKFLNTIVDDFGVFLIQMPWLRRLSVFRDDIIFAIYLYQRWIYKVDKTRDPYGQKKEVPKPAEQQQVTQGPAQQQQKPAEQTPQTQAQKPKKEENVTQRNVEKEIQKEEKEKEEPVDRAPNKTQSKIKKKKVE